MIDRRLGGGEEIRGGPRQAASRLGKNRESEEKSEPITPATKAFRQTNKSLFFFFFIYAVLSSFGLLCSFLLSFFPLQFSILSPSESLRELHRGSVKKSPSQKGMTWAAFHFRFTVDLFQACLGFHRAPLCASQVAPLSSIAPRRRAVIVWLGEATHASDAECSFITPARVYAPMLYYDLMFGTKTWPFDSTTSVTSQFEFASYGIVSPCFGTRLMRSEYRRLQEQV